MNPRSSLNAAYLLLTGVVIIALSLALVIFKPLLQMNLATKGEVLTRQQQVSTKQEFLRTIDRKKTELENALAQERALAVALPSEESMEDVARLLHRAALASGATLNRVGNVSVQAKRDQNIREANGEETSASVMLVPLALDIHLTGTYQQVRVFFDEVAKAIRLMNPVQITIEQTNQSSDQLTATATLHLYRYNDK